ncbi:MAG: hypothetical protein Q4C58_15605, partial [Eubacteriales bacterium]|nr:hypothetical protein [Eubacteriales bacterium]
RRNVLYLSTSFRHCQALFSTFFKLSTVFVFPAVELYYSTRPRKLSTIFYLNFTDSSLPTQRFRQKQTVAAGIHFCMPSVSRKKKKPKLQDSLFQAVRLANCIGRTNGERGI